MKLVTAFRLGRISNLPTIWSNVLAGAALAGAPIDARIDARFLGPVLLAMSLIYTAGMFFNDVFDRDYDREHRPDRPIPAGEATPAGASLWGAAMMLAALLLLAGDASLAAAESWYPLASAIVLCALVLLYDWRHKGNPFGPLIMGACRGMVYVTAALCVVAAFTPQLAVAALCLTAWVLGLTLVAKQNIHAGFAVLVLAVNVVIFIVAGGVLGLTESIVLSVSSTALVWALVYLCRDGKYWNPVTLLIAAIALLDALIIVSVTASFGGLALIAAGLFPVTLLFQRFIQGS